MFNYSPEECINLTTSGRDELVQQREQAETPPVFKLSSALPQEFLAGLLQHPPVSLCSLKGDLREPTTCHAFVFKVVLADVHYSDLLGNVFNGGGVGEWRAEQLCHTLHSVGL